MCGSRVGFTVTETLHLILIIHVHIFFPPPVSNDLFFLSLSTSVEFLSCLYFLPRLFSFCAVWFFSVRTRGWNAWCNASCLSPSSSFNKNVSIWLESCQESLCHGSNEWGWSERSGRVECVFVCLLVCVLGVRVSCHSKPYRRSRRMCQERKRSWCGKLPISTIYRFLTVSLYTFS